MDLININVLIFLATIGLIQGQNVITSQTRLVGGRTANEGNIQVLLEGSSEWRYICDDGFGFDEADAICRDMGFDGANHFTRNNIFGMDKPEWHQSSPLFLLERLDCSPNDTSYSDCSFGFPSVHDCGPTEIAGVQCRTSSSICSQNEFLCPESTCISRSEVCDSVCECSDCSDDTSLTCGDFNVIRLTRGIDINILGAVSGAVEIKHNGEWGVMCHDFTSEKEAKVVCNSLGYENGWSVPFMSSYFGVSEKEIVVYKPDCQGNEKVLTQCPNGKPNSISSSLCRRQHEFGVFCYNEGIEVQLASGNGRVELKLGEQWGSVCGTGFDIFDAQVLCRMLGYNGDAVAHRNGGRTNGPIWNFFLDCLGSEQNIQECRIRLMNETCSSQNTAAVTCSHRTGKIEEELNSLLHNPDCGIVEDAADQFLTSLAKVSGGTRPSRFDTPWIATLRSTRETGGELTCGAVIISDNYVLTAAHCLQLLGKLNLIVRVGDYNADIIEDSENDFIIDKIWVHENLNENAFFDNDIALLKIEKKFGQGIRFSSRVKSICLPSINDNYEELKGCSFAGWGRTFFLGEPQRILRRAETDVVSDYVCERDSFGGARNFTSSMACVSRTDVLACKGDSGGPLACSINGRQTLYGLVSTGKLCTFRDAADVYLRVTKYLDWILDKVRSSHS